MIAIMIKDVGAIFIPDVADLETSGTPNNITDWPVEEGGIKTDHISLGPITYNVKCRQSTIKVQSAGYDNNISRPAEAEDALVRARNERKIVDINTGTRKLKNMSITNIVGIKEREKANVIGLDITFKQINFATVKTIDALIQNPSQDADANISPDAKKTSNGTASDTPATQSTLSSILGN